MNKVRFAVNVVLFQLGWFACVLGAANGYPLLGPVVVTVAVGLHLAMAAQPAREVALLVFAALIGAVFDTVLLRTGWLGYPNGMLWANTAPYWMVAMWVLFATTLNVSMRWLHDRKLVGFLLGAIGGPLSYITGARLGGLEFIDQQAALVALAIGWGVVTPLLVELARQLDDPALRPVGVRHA